MLLGFSAVLLAFSGKPGLAAAAIIVAVVLDAIDGLIARKYQATHDLGKHLDSLADFLSFGVAPAILTWTIFGNTAPGIAFPLLLFVLCGGLRLARFNCLSTPGPYFGMPITANGIVLPMLFDLGAPMAGFTIWLILSAALMVWNRKIEKRLLQVIASGVIFLWIILHWVL